MYVSVCPLLGTAQKVTLDSFHWIHDCVSCCSRSAPCQGHVDKKPTSVLQTSCFTLYSKGMDCDIEETLAWLTEARRSSRPQRICKTACRAPDCPTALTQQGLANHFFTMNNPESNVKGGEGDRYKGILFLCARFYTEPETHKRLLAQRTHEAAREGTVPLCEEDLWKPKNTPESPHSGPKRQPAMKGPVSGILASATAVQALALLAV